MKSAIHWMAHNHVAANLLMLVFVVGGLIKGSSIKQEIFPEISLDKVQISVVYPGAGPDEVEEGILRKIEENISGVDGIKEVKSIAREGIGIVTAEIRAGEDADLVLQDIKNEVDRITTFPEDAEKPIITKLVNRIGVISIVVYGDVSERSLREQAEAIRDELLALPGITQVELGGVRPYEISIEIPEENLRRYNLTLSEVAQRIRRASVDIPGGTIKTEGGNILLRTKERRYHGQGYAEITVLTEPDGTEVKLGDIADVKDTFREIDQFARFDGKPAAMVNVFRVGNQKPTEIAKKVKEFVERKRAMLPDSIKIATWDDRSEILQGRINLLLKNATMGLVLVLIVLGVFLEIRLALWVMLGIPISFLGALFVMPALDVSINMISLFAFILALGIVVDDAIVVGESVYEHRQMGKPYLRAAIDGVLEVYVPVIFSVLTTIMAFVPLLFVSGMIGKFIKVIPLVVITIFVVSLVEALFVLPSHLSGGKKVDSVKGILMYINHIQRGFAGLLARFISGPYNTLLNISLRNRYATLSIGIAILLLSFGLIKGGFIKFTFMPEVEGDLVIASLKMPPGTPVKETERIERFIEKKAMDTVSYFDERHPDRGSVLRHIFSIVGGSIISGGPEGESLETASNLAEVALLLQRSEDRLVSATTISDMWREKVGELPGVDSLTFTSNIVHIGADIDIELSHDDFKVLEAASRRVKKALAQYPGVEDIADNYSKGKKEIKFKLKPEALTLGITEEELGRQIRAAFYGAEALRFQRRQNEVKVMVRYPEEERRSLWNLESMRIRTPDGGELPLGEAAYVTIGKGFTTINRTDRKRVVNITARVDSKIANAEEVLSDIKSNLLQQLTLDYPGLTFDLVGEEKERRESMGSMRSGFLLALFGIFALLAIPFRSYSQPLLIMTSIPFGMVGAVAGHLIMGYDLSILSMFGLVALAGVVVNDSLLLIDKINRDRREGSELFKAVVEAGKRRFRPILLTSLTTFFGLTPMILEKSVQARFLIPMAISLGFGILFATGITLILIPSLYMILEDILSVFGIKRVALKDAGDSEV